jgi:O-methyltransferase
MAGGLSLSGKIRQRLSRLLWPQVADSAWTYDSDGFRTQHSAAFLRDPRFVAAYAQAQAIGAWNGADIRWRAYTVCWAAMRGASLEGDFVECGVDRGGFSRAAMDYIGFAEMPEKKFYLIDTFEGIPLDTLTDDPNREFLRKAYQPAYESVVRTFSPFPNAVIVRGKVPEVLPAVAAEKVCYLCIDLNTAGPSVAAAEFFWDRLVSGATIVLDDYAQTFFKGMQEGLDQFARRRGVEVLSLPTGQGLIFKP